MFFLIYFIWPFAVAMEGGRFLLSSTDRLVQVVKWTFLTDWSKIFLTGMKRSVWYHLARSGLIIISRAFSADGCCLLG